MPLPTYPTEADLAVYLHSLVETARLAGIIKWTAPAAPSDLDPDGALGSYADVLTDAAIMIAPAALVPAVTPAAVAQARLAGAVALWRRVSIALVTAYDFTAATGGSLSRQQLREHVKEVLSTAEAEASALGIAVHALPPISIVGVDYSGDPYRSEWGTYAERSRIARPRRRS